MKICKVNSLPLREVIESLAECFGVNYEESCGEYFVKLPDSIGTGQIRAINFDNGLGIIIYQCEFFEDVRIDFTVNKVHPIKYIYSVKGPFSHRFANDDTTHEIDQYKCAIVASESNNGHIISFQKGQPTEVVSLEINREKFLEITSCELKELSPELQQLFEDVKADNTFYHEGFYGLEFNTILKNISMYEDQKLIRKFYLESIGLQIFVNQLVQFQDDLLTEPDKSILRINELKQVEETATYISQNLDKDLSVAQLSRLSGLNPNKLQTAFKYLFKKTVNEYVIDAKLKKSLSLLKSSELNVSDVAILIGIKSYSYFSKVFKQKYKVTPSEYKDLNK